MKLNKTLNKLPKAQEIYHEMFYGLVFPQAKPPEFVMKKMRGNARSRFMLIAPPPFEEEYNFGMPLTSSLAKTFHEILMDNDLDTERDFLVVSCSCYGKKPSKDSTDRIKNYIQICAAENLFDVYVSVGADAFKFLFGAGKKPSSSTLYGNPLYLEMLQPAMLYCFPDLHFLGDQEQMAYHERRIADKVHREFHLLAQKLKVLLEIAAQ
jgi:hypothetical protein